jgi:uncharacterized protein with FMN-binding domain
VRRAVIAIVATIAGVVAVLSYHSPPVERRGDPRPRPTTAQLHTYLGPRERAVDPRRGTDYGVVQVEIDYRDGRIVGIRTPLLPPTDDRAGKGTWATTGLLSRGSATVLIRKVLAAQSAQVHTVSGATWTSEAFLTSLQGALAQALSR